MFSTNIFIHAKKNFFFLFSNQYSSLGNSYRLWDRHIFFGYINFKWTEYRIETKYSMYWKFPRRTSRQKGWKLKNFFCNELSKYIRGEIIYKIMMIKEYDLSIISWNGHFVKSDQMSGEGKTYY